MADALNPYAAPKAAVEGAADDTGVQWIRRAHLSCEASIRSLGLLYYLAAASGLISAFAAAVRSRGGPGGSVAELTGYVIAGVVVGVAGIAIGHGLRSLRKWVRVPVTLLSILGLLAFPIGTLVNAYVLWLLWSAKGRMVLSDRYVEVVRATPHLRYRTSRIVLVALALLMTLIAAGIILPAFLL